MDVRKQIEYWRTSSDEDFAAAESLLERGHFRHSLFFAHLAIEKILKAHVVCNAKDVPPKIHGLARLGYIGGVAMSKEQSDFLLEFGVYQLEGRYPDSQQMPLRQPFVKKEIAKAKELLEWLKAQLPRS